MSLGKMISEKRDRQRRVIEVPEWGDDDAPLLIYSSAITAGDLNKIQKKHKNFLIDGNKLFTLEDKIYLMGEEMSVIATVAGQMFNDIDTIEDAEKN